MKTGRNTIEIHSAQGSILLVYLSNQAQKKNRKKRKSKKSTFCRLTNGPLCTEALDLFFDPLAIVEKEDWTFITDPLARQLELSKYNMCFQPITVWPFFLIVNLLYLSTNTEIWNCKGANKKMSLQKCLNILCRYLKINDDKSSALLYKWWHSKLAKFFSNVENVNRKTEVSILRAIILKQIFFLELLICNVEEEGIWKILLDNTLTFFPEMLVQKLFSYNWLCLADHFNNWHLFLNRCTCICIQRLNYIEVYERPLTTTNKHFSLCN